MIQNHCLQRCIGNFKHMLVLHLKWEKEWRKRGCKRKGTDGQMAQNDTSQKSTFTKYCLNYFLTAGPGISFFLKWNSFPFHKRKQFPRNYYPSLFADKMLKSHSILHSPGWTQFSSSIRPPKLSLWKFPCTQSISFYSTSQERTLKICGDRIQTCVTGESKR